MTALRKTLFLFCIAIAALALSKGAVRGGSDTIAFDHSAHSQAEASCVACHAAVLNDRGLKQVLPTKEPSCSRCHDVKSKEGCATCHSAPESARPFERRTRKTNFLHSQHEKATKDCASCHKEPDHKPHKAGDHKSCGACHAKDLDNLLCAKCHRDFSFAGLTALTRFTHKANFLTEHGAYATRSVRTCAQCHTETFCTECHGKKAGLRPSIKYPEAVKRNFVHRGDYLTLHRIEAKTNGGRCLKCHAAKQCESCHTRSGVSARASRPANRHPSTWMNKGGSDFHGDAARKDIVACASCHRGRGPGYCIDCHKAGQGLSPHGQGFPQGLDKGQGACAKCHDK